MFGQRPGRQPVRGLGLAHVGRQRNRHGLPPGGGRSEPLGLLPGGRLCGRLGRQALRECGRTLLGEGLAGGDDALDGVEAPQPQPRSPAHRRAGSAI